MSKLVGYVKSQFKDKATGRVIDYAKVFVGDPIVEGGAGMNVFGHKAQVDVVEKLKPEFIGKEVTVYFDKYQRVQFVGLSDK